MLTRESWSTCWYTPLVALGGLLIMLLILALVVVKVLIADVPGAVSSYRDPTLAGGRLP